MTARQSAENGALDLRSHHIPARPLPRISVDARKATAFGVAFGSRSCVNQQTSLSEHIVFSIGYVMFMSGFCRSVAFGRAKDAIIPDFTKSTLCNRLLHSDARPVSPMLTCDASRPRVAISPPHRQI
jgi:hypothetical protein